MRGAQLMGHLLARAFAETVSSYFESYWTARPLPMKISWSFGSCTGINLVVKQGSFTINTKLMLLDTVLPPCVTELVRVRV